MFIGTMPDAKSKKSPNDDLRIVQKTNFFWYK
jgi:hypothetical protein